MLNASYIRWYSDYEKALSLAKKENKPLMVVIRKQDCTNCQKMFETTFKDQDYIDKLNDKYISVIAIYEDENNYPIELFYTLDFPAVFFISSQDESFLCKPIFGFISPHKFKVKLQKLLIDRD